VCSCHDAHKVLKTSIAVTFSLVASGCAGFPLLQVHTHASYAYCDEADAFRTASYLANMKQPGAAASLAFLHAACHHDCDTALPPACIASGPAQENGQRLVYEHLSTKLLVPRVQRRSTCWT
jgi:hypothetical protein